jgi:hypothetical protein
MEQDPKEKAVKDILAGLRSRRPADQSTGDATLEQKVASITGVEFEPGHQSYAKVKAVEVPSEISKDVVNIPPLHLDLESLLTLSEKQELETRESYEVSLDGAIEAMKDTKGIVELKNQNVPTIVISDLHARRDFLMNVLSQQDQDGYCVFDLMEKGKINVVCLGDGMHSENRENWKVFDPNPARGEGFMELNPQKMEKEMIASLGLMKIVMELKANFPESFHYVRGNHDDIGETITKFMKYVPEEVGGESGVVKWWTEKYFGKDFLDKWVKFESMLPLVVRGKGFVASHTISKDLLTRDDINNRNQNAVNQLLWTDNRDIGDISPENQKIFKDNLRDLGAANSKWIIGHRPVHGKFRSQFEGQLIQINSSQKQLVAIVPSDETFDPEKNIFDLRVEGATGLDVGWQKYTESEGALEQRLEEWRSQIEAFVSDPKKLKLILDLSDAAVGSFEEVFETYLRDGKRNQLPIHQQIILGSNLADKLEQFFEKSYSSNTINKLYGSPESEILKIVLEHIFERVNHLIPKQAEPSVEGNQKENFQIYSADLEKASLKLHGLFAKKFDKVISNYLQKELLKDQASIALYKKEEISFSPEQQRIIETIRRAAIGFFADKKTEAENWEGFNDDEKKNMLDILMKGALRVQYEKRLISVGAPNDAEIIKKYIEDIMKGII